MSKVLVTGADGFIGSHLVDYLVRKGYSVRAFCYYNSFSHCGWLSDLDEQVQSNIDIVYGDIRDGEIVEKYTIDCSCVMHLASLITIPYSYHAPRSYVDTNISGTLNVLNAAKKSNAHVIHTSTSEVYGTAQYVPIDEKHPLNAQSPYAATKIAADQIALSFYRSFDSPVSVVRPFNTFGPRQSARAIIPAIITQLLNGKNLRLGETDSTRDFTYVEDTVKGIEAFINNEEAIGKTINLGTGFEISIKNLISEIASIMDIEIDLSTDENRLRPEKSEVMRLCSDNSLAKNILKWQPASSDLEGLRQGLERTVEWLSLGRKNTPLDSAVKYIY